MFLANIRKKYNFGNACLRNDNINKHSREARWPSGRASDSGARGRGLDSHSGRRVVSLSKIHSPPKSTGNIQEAVAPSRRD